MLQDDYSTVKITRFRDADSDCGRVPSPIQFRSNYDLVQRVNAAIELALPSGDSENHVHSAVLEQCEPVVG